MKRGWAIAGGLATGTAFGFAGCSLSLDTSFRDAPDASVGGMAGASGGQGATGGIAGGGAGGTGGAGAGAGGSTGGMGGMGGSGAAAGSAGTGGSAGGCSTAGDCTTATACLEGACVMGQCVFELCPSATACMARACDEGAGSCGSEQPVLFNAAQLAVDDDVSCAGQPRRCIGAMGSFVVVGTMSGLRAWNIRNPLEPQDVTVDQPAFAVAWVRSSGNRVLVVGSVSSGQVSVGWIDLPSDPFTTSLRLQSALVNVTETDVGTVLAATPNDFYFSRTASAGTFFPSALVAPPLVPNSTVTLFPQAGAPTTGQIVAGSGTRLVTYRTDTTMGFAPFLGLESNAGTDSAQFDGEQNLAGTAGEVPTALTAHQFHGAPSGDLAWSTNAVFRNDAGIASTNTVRFYWPLLGEADTFDASRQVDVESYSMAFDQNQPLAGPPLILDDTTALAIAADPANSSQSVVRAVGRSGDTLSLLANRQWTLAASINQLGVADGSRYGFVLAGNTAGVGNPPNTTVHVFDPLCEQ